MGQAPVSATDRGHAGSASTLLCDPGQALYFSEPGCPHLHSWASDSCPPWCREGYARSCVEHTVGVRLMLPAVLLFSDDDHHRAMLSTNL